MVLPVRPSRDEFPALPRRPIRVLLDGVYYLPNIGTIFRLCDAFRIERLCVCGFALEPHKRALRKAAAGARPCAIQGANGGSKAADVRLSCAEQNRGGESDLRGPPGWRMEARRGHL